MANDMINKSRKIDSGFYLNQLDELKEKLIQLEEKRQKTLLLGVSFALLDLVERHSFNLHYTLIMETGGMKGRRKELTREDLHERLKKASSSKNLLGIRNDRIAVSSLFKREGNFECPPWMQVAARENEDPLSQLPWGQSGGLNVIDLANRDSCSFIATDDLAKVHSNSCFEVLGRLDTSEIRGCNLMVI